MTEHPITPPPELVEQWVQATESSDCIGAFPTNFEKRICTAAARWGADQELEACCEWLVKEGWFRYEHEAVQDLHSARRPKPPSLKAQALAELVDAYDEDKIDDSTYDTIRRALEQLDD
jgi:hypothetical protein